MGCLPIRDMMVPPLPNRAEQLAAEPLGPRLAVAHDAAAGTENGDAQAVEDRTQFLVSPIQTPSGLAGARDVANDALAFGTVLEEDTQDHVRFLDLVDRLKLRATALVL